MMMSLMLPPPGIIGSTFSSLPMRQSIQLGPFCFIASAKAAFADAMKQQGPSWIDCRIGKDEKVLPMIPGGGTVNDIIME